MIINRIKLILAAIIVLPLLGIAALQGTTVNGSPATVDAAADYKAKCAMCHGQTAEKKFDVSKTDDVLVEVVLKGKADAKPLMPGYEAKGMTKEQAQALVAHMRSLRPAS
jgi:mono/diheme cytochrome c family protein